MGIQFLFIVSSLCLAVGAKSIDILFPTSPTIVWSNLNPEAIECGGKSSVPEITGGTKIIGKTPILNHDYIINGFLCTGVNLITKCSENFLGSRTVESLEIHHELKESDCVEAITAQMSGVVKVVSYPPEDCYWMQTTSATASYTQITSRALVYDPYANTAVSELFPGGVCRNNFCPTIHRGQYWVSNDHQPPSCKTNLLESVVFVLESQGGDAYDFWSPDFNIPSGHKICNLHFCGMTGFMFHDQTWVAIEPNKLPKDPASSHFFEKIPPCNKSTHLNMLEKEYSVHVAEQNILDKFMESECLKTKENLILGNPVSRVELQSLAPRTPGQGRVYRLANGTIETGISHYRYVKIIAPLGNNPIIVRDSQGQTIRYHYWVDNPLHNIIDGPNGLFIHNGAVAFHSYDIEEYRLALAVTLKQKIPIIPPSLHSIQQGIDDGVERRYHRLDSKVPHPIMSFHIPKSISWIVYGGLSVVSLILIFLIIRYFTPMCRRRNPRDNLVTPSVYYKP